MADDTPNTLSPADQAAMQPETFANPLVKKKIDNMVKLLSIPGQALNSEQPVTTDDMIKPARDMAMQFGAIGLPMSKPGSAGIFGGKLAQGADLQALKEAQNMAAKGVHPTNVMNDTGWFRGPADQQWRFEIPDNKAALKYMPSTEGDLASGSAASLMHHPELYKNYPQLQSSGMTITRQSGEPSGLWANNTANVVAPNMAQGRSVGLHELQHGVQGIEGFSPGNNPAYYAYQIEKGMKNNPEQFKNYDFNELSNQAHDLYHRTAGEVEARNVQHRADFSPTLRRQPEAMPWLTQDTPYIDQFHFNPVTSTLTALRDKR